MVRNRARGLPEFTTDSYVINVTNTRGRVLALLRENGELADLGLDIIDLLEGLGYHVDIEIST